MWCSVACHSDKWQNGCGAPSHITTTQWQVTELVWCSVAYHSNTVTSDSMGVALCGTSDVLVDLADIFHCLLLAYSLCLYVCIVLHSATHSMFILCVCTVQHIPCFHCLLLFGLLFLYSVTQGSPFHFVHCVCTVLYSAIVSAFFFLCLQDERRRIEDLGGCVLFLGVWRVNGNISVSRAIGKSYVWVIASLGFHLLCLQVFICASLLCH